MKNRFKVVLVSIVVCMSIFMNCQTISNFIISDEDEIEIGNKFKQQIVTDKEQYPLYSDRADHDPRVVKFIDSLGYLLSRVQADRPSLDFTFTIVDDTVVNAFAIPGGHVFVYKGLLLKAQNGAEVAGVLAHEIGHITKYHGKKMLASQVAVSNVNAILFGDSATVASVIANLFTNMAFLKYSRSNEYEADSCAVAYTAKAATNPWGMHSFLEKLGDGQSMFEKYSEPFSTHPDIKKRLDNVKDEIGKIPNVPATGEKMFESEYLSVRNLLK